MVNVSEMVSAGNSQQQKQLREAQQQRQAEMEAQHKDNEREIRSRLEYDLHTEVKDMETLIEGEKKLVSLIFFGIFFMKYIEKK